MSNKKKKDVYTDGLRKEIDMMAEQFARESQKKPVVHIPVNSTSVPNKDKDEAGNSCSVPGPARGGYQSEDYDDDILAALSLEPEKQVKKTLTVDEILPLPLKVSERCLELGYLIGPVTQRLGKRALEVGGFFLYDQKNGDFSLTDFIVPKNLPVAPGAILIADHYPKAADEIKEINERGGTDFRLSAMFHIHPSKNRTGLFHSVDDNKGLDSLVNKMAETNRKILETPYNLIESRLKKEYGRDDLVLRGDELSDAVVRFVYPNDEMFFRLLQSFGFNPDPNNFDKSKFLGELLDNVESQTSEPRAVRWATSFVFENDREGPYIKMQIEEKFGLTGTVKRYILTNPKIEIINKGENLPTEAEVTDLVRERVMFPPKRKIFSGLIGPTGQVIVGAGIKGQTPDDEEIDWSGFDQTNTRGVYVSSGAYPANPTQSHWLAGNQTPAKPLPKLEHGKLHLDDLAKAFSFAVMGYLSQYRDSSVKYSEYISKLFEMSSQFENKTSHYDWQTKTQQPPFFTKGDLASNVLDLGELFQDSEVIKPIGIYSYQADNLADNIANFHRQFSDGYTREFISRFTNAGDMEQKNKLIADYVNGVHKRYQDHVKKDLETPTLTKTDETKTKGETGHEKTGGTLGIEYD